MASYIQGDLLTFLNKIDEEGMRSKSSYASKWETNVRVMRGNFWPDGASPLFSANLIAPAIGRKTGLLTEAKPELDVLTRKAMLGPTADVLRMTIGAIWDEQQVAMTLEKMGFFQALFGSGLIKTTYDPYADYGMGDIIIAPVDPRMVLVDPAVVNASRLVEGQYLREEYVVPLTWVQQRYERTAKNIQPDNNLLIANAEQYKISWLQRAVNRMFKRNNSGDVESAIPRIYIREYWIADPTQDKNGNMLYPGGRVILRTGDDTILNPDDKETDIADRYGQQNPYWDGMNPYDMWDNEPDMDHPWGHAEVDKLKKLNESFNRVGNAAVSTLVKNLEWVIADANSLKTEDVLDLKRLQAVVLEKSAGRDVRREPPTQPTATNMDFMRLMISLIEMQVGLSDGAMQGKGRVELRSEPQLEGLQQVAQTLIRSQARRMEAFLERVGQKLVSRVFQFYTDDRIMTYVDNEKLKLWTFKKDELKKEILQQVYAEKREEAKKETEKNMEDGKTDLSKALVLPKNPTVAELEEAMRGAWKLFRFKIRPFSSLASNRSKRAGMLMELAQQGWIPPSKILMELGFDNYDDLLQEVAIDTKKRAQFGLPPPAPPSGKKGGKK